MAKRIVNTQTGNIVRVGDKCSFFGWMYVEVAGFTETTIWFCNVDSCKRFSLPLADLGLEWQEGESKQPWELMTNDDWICASNGAIQIGGHFMTFLAKAFQHADGGNQPPIKKAYAQHFYRYLPKERKDRLEAEAAKT